MLTIVLVHGAFADASSWKRVLERLQNEGHTVVAPANPLRGLADDTRYIASVADQIDGPVLLSLLSAGRLQQVIAGRLPLENMVTAHQQIERAEVQGKLVLVSNH